MEILQQLEENRVKTAQEISRLEQLISKMQKRLNYQRAEELLKDIKAALTGTEAKFEKPKGINADLSEGEFIGPLQYKVWKKMRDVMDRPVLDSFTIAPKTASPELTVSEDGTSVQWSKKQQDVPNNPERFIWHCAALGSKGFTSGRHYWEVEVGDQSCWSLGVVRRSVERKTRISTSPVNGFYCLKKVLEYWAFYFQWTHLPLTVRARKIGVYLDYEGGQVSFYNTENMSHIYTYTDTFTEKMYPFFNTWWNDDRKKPEPLKLITLNN
nr:PREDICTED: zinc-binding protein A33-like [Latimeria chalumnae]|eukprot:XP_014345222.1 PREDICTED: zinc-binding protein A33-like [Latimeria chalumnae]